MGEIIIEDLEQLENYARETMNWRLINVIRKFKNSENIDERILALASIIRSLRRKGVFYTGHFLRHCLLYLFEERGWRNEVGRN